jgi:hypothetical protein
VAVAVAENIFQMCRVDDTNPASLVIETTITDKSSGEEVLDFTKVEVAPQR